MEAKHKMVLMHIDKYTHMRECEEKSIQLFVIKRAG